MAFTPQVKKATKLDARLRLCLCGPAGSGKSYSSLLIAREMVGPEGKILAIDTERGSLSLYVGLPGIGDFDVTDPEVFDPRELIATIDYAVANKYEALIIDSLSHYWSGVGGELDMIDAAQKRGQGNSFTAWKSVTPIHNQLVDKLIGSRIHVITTLRVKVQWVVEAINGKNIPKKIGMEAIMKEGIEHEYQVVGTMDQENNLIITKSRCPDLNGKVINRPGAEMAKVLKDWLHGAPLPESEAIAAPEPPAVAPPPLAPHLARPWPSKGPAVGPIRPRRMSASLRCWRHSRRKRSVLEKSRIMRQWLNMEWLNLTSSAL